MLVRNILALAVAATCGACASSSRIERSAERHQARAQQLESQGNVAAASKERAAAAKQVSKANTRRGFEDVLPVAFY